MHKSPPRRRELTVRALTYVIMTVSVLAAVALCLFVILGYSVDEKTGRAQQGGLLQFRSFPGGANVTIDGALQTFKTSNKATINAGAHTVTMSRDKYRDWSRDFVLKSSEVLWLNARLVPGSITTNEAAQFESVSNTKSSPDKKRYAVVEKANSPLLKIFDLTDEDQPKISQLKIPDAAMKPVAETDTFKIVEWDFGGRYLLVQHISSSGTEWLRLDRTNPDNTINITSKLGLKFSDGHFAGNSGDIFYVLGDDNSLRKLDLDSGTVSGPIASDVREFQLYKNNRLVMVAQKNSLQTVSVYKQGAKKPVELQTYLSTVPVHAALSSYFEDEYVALSRDKAIDLIKNPFEEKRKVASFDLETAASWVYFSNNGQFVVAQNGAQLASFDIERGKKFRFSVPAGPAYNPTHQLEWLDDFRLLSDAGGSLAFIEFDGTNIQTIGNALEGHSVTLSDDGKRLYSIGTNVATKRPVLQSSMMVVE